jgi:hypothetical protein
MKDFWGNEALDFGLLQDLLHKYKDNIFVSVSKEPMGQEYVLFICDEGLESKARKYATEYKKKLRDSGVTVFAVGVHFGSRIFSKKVEDFHGGVFYGI